MGGEELAVVMARHDERLISVQKSVDQVLVQLTRLNGRVSELEKWRSRLAGALIVIGAIAGVNATVIARLLLQ